MNDLYHGQRDNEKAEMTNILTVNDKSKSSLLQWADGTFQAISFLSTPLITSHSLTLKIGVEERNC